MSSLIWTEVIPNQLPFQSQFSSAELCTFCGEVFTLASFVTISLAVLFAGLAIFAVMYWMTENDHKPEVIHRKYSRKYLRLHRL